MKSPTLFGYTSKEKKRWVLCAVVCVFEFKQAGCLFLDALFPGKRTHFSCLLFPGKCQVFYCSYPFSLRIKQKLRRMSSNTGEDAKLCGVCVLAASEKEKTKGCI